MSHNEAVFFMASCSRKTSQQKFLKQIALFICNTHRTWITIRWTVTSYYRSGTLLTRSPITAVIHTSVIASLVIERPVAWRLLKCSIGSKILMYIKKIKSTRILSDQKKLSFARIWGISCRYFQVDTKWTLKTEYQNLKNNKCAHKAFVPHRKSHSYQVF